MSQLKEIIKINPDLSINKIQIELTANLIEAYRNYTFEEIKENQKVWLVGSIMGDWFISTVSPEEKGERVIYPMPLEVSPKDFLDCEVTKILEQ